MNRTQFIRVLCLVQGFKTATKNLHWSEINNGQKHKTLDDIYAALNKFEDDFAEDGMTVFGSIDQHEIVSYPIEYNDGADFVAKLERFSRKCKQIVSSDVRTGVLDDDAQFAGLNALCDEFVHAMKINFFRYQMD